MDFKIGEDILTQTTKCKRDFACLSDEEYPLCRILSAVGTRVLVTNCPVNNLPCNYCQAITPSEGWCVCPTKVERFNRYGF